MNYEPPALPEKYLRNEQRGWEVRVRDPYVNVEIVRTYNESLIPTGLAKVQWDYFSFGLAIIPLIILSTVGLPLIITHHVLSGVILETIGALIWLTTLPPCVAGSKYFARQDRAVAAYLKTEIIVDRCRHHRIEQVSDRLHQLPPHERENLRPLWQSMLTASEVLTHLPDDERAQELFRQNADEIIEAVRHYESIEKEIQLRQAQEKVAPLQAELEASAAHDRETALNYRQSLNEGLRALQ